MISVCFVSASCLQRSWGDLFSQEAHKQKLQIIIEKFAAALFCSWEIHYFWKIQVLWQDSKNTMSVDLNVREWKKKPSETCKFLELIESLIKDKTAGNLCSATQEKKRWWKSVIWLKIKWETRGFQTWLFYEL